MPGSCPLRIVFPRKRLRVASTQGVFLTPCIAMGVNNVYMPERVQRLNPTTQTLKRLFALSRNRCAFYECACPVVNEYGQLIAEVCHIEAANKLGERFNPDQSNEDRRRFENLILLCERHHTETNDVTRFSTATMKKMKASHEAKANIENTPDDAIQQRFIDQSTSSSLQLPRNLLQLDLSGVNSSFFSDACEIMSAVANLPNLTRSLYANALANSRSGDFFIYCDPLELAQRLNINHQSLDPHFSILEGSELMWFPEWRDDWGNLPTQGCRSYFRQFDRDDNGIYFLMLVCRRFSKEKALLVDIFESLNFQLLDA